MIHVLYAEAESVKVILIKAYAERSRNLLDGM